MEERFTADQIVKALGETGLDKEVAGNALARLRKDNLESSYFLP